MKWFVLSCGLVLSGCGFECDEGDSRCDDNAVYVCEGRTWERIEDCGAQDLRCNVGGFCGSGACCQL